MFMGNVIPERTVKAIYEEMVLTVINDENSVSPAERDHSIGR